MSPKPNHRKRQRRKTSGPPKQQQLKMPGHQNQTTPISTRNAAPSGDDQAQHPTGNESLQGAQESNEEKKPSTS